MLETLLRALERFGGWLLPWAVLDEYECGVLLRLGRFRRVLEPGWHWIIPFGVDHVILDNAVTATTVLSPQSLTTRDGVSVTLALVLTWRIRDAEKFLLRVEGRETVLQDAACALASAAVSTAEWHELAAAPFCDTLRADVRKRAFRYGVEVEGVGFQSLARCESLRLWTDAKPEVIE